MPACTTTNYAACFNPLVDYGYGILDVPHRVIIAPIWQLPFGKDRRWANERRRRTRSPAAGRSSAVVNLQSGFPIGVAQSDNTLLAGANAAEPRPGVELRDAGRSRRPSGVGRPSDRDLDQPGGVHGGAGRHVRQRAAPRSPTCGRRRSSNTDLSVVEELRPERRQVGADQGRDHQPVQPGADEQHRRRRAGNSTFGQISDAVRVHADDADDVPLLVLEPTDARTQRSPRSAETEPCLSGFCGSEFAAVHGVSCSRARVWASAFGLCLLLARSRPLAAQPPLSRPHLLSHIRLRRRRRRRSSAASCCSTASSTTTRSRRSGRRSGSIPASRWRTGARRSPTTSRSGTTRTSTRRARRWPGWRRRAPRGRRRRRRLARRRISTPSSACSATATRPARDRAYADRMAALHRAVPGRRRGGGVLRAGAAGDDSRRPAQHGDLAEGRRDRARRSSRRIPSIPAPRTTRCTRSTTASTRRWGCEAARTYARIAPASSHARHMPSHVFLPLGHVGRSGGVRRVGVRGVGRSRASARGCRWRRTTFTPRLAALRVPAAGTVREGARG